MSLFGIESAGASELKKREIAAMHKQFSGVLYDFCLRLLGDKAEAEDAVQEVFLSAYRAFDSFTFGDSRLPWLYRIASNTCFKILRTRRRKGLTLVEDTDRNVGANLHPADTLHARRMLEKVAGQLDERGFDILVGHYLSGMTQDEIADMLGISRRAVVKRLTALRKQVGLFIEEE
jgi:RNA polymerase sigma-70 factor (ECF subfamily)